MPEDKAGVSSSSTGRNLRYLVSHSTYLAAIGKIPDTLPTHKRTFMKGHDLIHEGQRGQNAYLLRDGWACSYRILHDGTRQIINFHIPGDLVGIRRLITFASDDNLCAITRMEAEEISVDDLSIALRGNSCLAMSILWSAFRDEAIVTQHLIDVGRRHPINRAAHLFLELGSRLNLAGLGTKTAFECPLTQSLVADALSLTTVHFNRVLRQLRELNAMTFHDGRVAFLDSRKLEHLADFDSSYLR
ncbi:Crp/Fnr family transcriptional regulator [Rhizobium sp. NPDC090279]|uniref:Crp/Fnr family transcriptional regulator n=1 Tax=Rhizobium sp. NPDC090279 TaxID=3364499 RepID=UPI00383ADE58